jgi:hypothetical protein
MYVQRVTYLVIAAICLFAGYRIGLRRGDTRATRALGEAEIRKMRNSIQTWRNNH